MTLDKAGLASALQSIFEDTSPGTTAANKAAALADAVDVYVKTALVEASIPAGTVVASAEIPVGAVSVGASPSVIVNVAPIPITLSFNANPIAIDGDPDAASPSDTAGGLS